MWYDEERKKAYDNALDEAGFFTCATCGMPRALKKEVEVHHVYPVCPHGSSFGGWGPLVKRLFCKAKDLKVMCKECHAKEKGK